MDQYPKGGSMAVYTVTTTITGTFTYTDLYLEGKHILLSYDGNQTYKSTDALDLTDALILQWVGQGLSYQGWTISVQFASQDQAAGMPTPNPWTKQGQIPAGGGSQLYQEIKLS
jgi:hypothetical protein